MSASRRIQVYECSQICLPPVSIYVSRMSQSHHTSPPQGGTLRPAGRFGLVSYQITTFAVGPGALEICAHPLRVKSLPPSVLWGSCNQPHTPSKPNVLDVSLLGAGPPGWGGLAWGSELSLLWEKLWNVIILQLVGCLPGEYRIW